MPKFPHLKDSTDYPRVDNINVYKNENDFDYQRYGTSLQIELCNVKWKSDYADTVDWQTEEKRDEYFNGITKKITLESAINKYPEGAIHLPLPFNEVHKYNYIILTYNPFTSPDNLVDYETDEGINKYFFFLDSCEMAAANSTKCNLVLDVWTTYISRIDINYLMLQRGHAPLAAIDVDTYLKNPIDNNTLLLAPDVNYGECDNVVASADAVFNDGEMYACIATTTDPTQSFGTKYGNDWRTPAPYFHKEQGVPSCFVFAMDSENIGAFFENADKNCPQFKQTVKAIFFVAKKLVTPATSFTFLNTTCYTLVSTQKQLNLMDLKKTDFNFPEQYAHLTKLYTFPYSKVEISDASGNVLTVRIENTNGDISIQSLLSIAFPHLGLDIFFGGVGGEKMRQITFKNLDPKSVILGGRWYEYFQHWDIPCYEIVQQASLNYDFNTHWKREQEKIAADTAYTNAEASASTSYNNSVDSANTANTNVNNSANTSINNQAIANTASIANQNTSNAAATYVMTVTNKTNEADTFQQDGLAEDVVKADSEYVNATSWGGFYNALAIGSANAIAGLAANNYGGSLASFVGGVSNAMLSRSNGTALIQAKQTEAQAGINRSNAIMRQDQRCATDIVNENNAAHSTATQRTATANANQTANTSNTEKTNAANTASTNKNNALRTYNQTVANAERSKNVAYKNIENNVRQNALNDPLLFGENVGNSADVTMPQMLTANLVTQSQGEIAQTANEFLRWGYTLGQQWNFNTFSVMKNFSYWKASEVWLYSEEGVNNAILDYIRKILINGTTVWTNPDNVCSISIFDN